tara:strand:- start:91 stop:291 length:201 start_codon:yes stop_codon:yes gene_type:complete
VWELWQWDGRYIKGKKIKRSKTKETVVKHAKESINYKKIVKGDNKNEFFLEDSLGRPVGMIINREE